VSLREALNRFREVIEKSLINPTPEDLSRIRREAINAAVRQGACEESVQVDMEVDAKNNLVRAVATGATELRQRNLADREATDDEIKAKVEKAFSFEHQGAALAGETSGLKLYTLAYQEKKFLGLIKKQRTALAAADREGIVRMKKAHARCFTTSREKAATQLQTILDDFTIYGDGGAIIPPIYLIFGSRIVDLSQLAGAEQMAALSATELSELPSDENVAFAVCPEGA